MAEITTEHRGDTTVRVVHDGAVDYEFDVDSSGDGTPSHEYRGEGTPPEWVNEALTDWVVKYHGDSGADS